MRIGENDLQWELSEHHFGMLNRDDAEISIKILEWRELSCPKQGFNTCPSRLFILAAYSSGPANIFMMQTANSFEFDHFTLIWRLFAASFRSVLV